MPSERTPDGESLKGLWIWMAKASVVWAVLTLWIVYKLSSRDIPMDVRAWSVAFGGGFYVVAVQTCVALLILRDPPKSLLRRRRSAPRRRCFPTLAQTRQCRRHAVSGRPCSVRRNGEGGGS